LRILSGVTRSAVRLAVATLMVAAVGLGVPAPAQASTCGSAHGVSVVVDFHELGGGVQTFCDAGGAGKTADAQLRDAGHELTYVQRQPGFICRIDDKPADDPCVNTPPSDAYWALWWSDGKSGTWSYSSQGASSLKVPEGGYVGMSWQGSDSRTPPGVPPTAHASQPSSGPSSHPTSPPPSNGPGQPPPSSTAPGSALPTSGTTPPQGTGGHGKHLDRSKTGQVGSRSSHGPEQTEAGEPLGDVAPTDAADAADASGDSGDSGGIPGWVAPVAIVVLFLGAGTVALVRRKTSGGA
jgi:hypothetical protein